MVGVCAEVAVVSRGCKAQLEGFESQARPRRYRDSWKDTAQARQKPETAARGCCEDVNVGEMRSSWIDYLITLGHSALFHVPAPVRASARHDQRSARAGSLKIAHL